MNSKLPFVVTIILTGSLYAGAQAKPKTKISLEEAKTTAIKKESGTIRSSELEREHGRWIYSFDIATGDGVHEVNIDANTGNIVEDSKETAADEAKEAAADRNNEQKKASRSHTHK